MPSLNKVHLIGNLTREPALKAMTNSTQVCEFALAINSRYRSQDGVDHENTTFVDIFTFGKLAAACARFLHKGASAYVEGKLVNTEFTDRNGMKHSKMRVRAERVLFLDPKNNMMNDAEMAGDPVSYAINHSNMQPQAQQCAPMPQMPQMGAQPQPRQSFPQMEPQF